MAFYYRRVGRLAGPAACAQDVHRRHEGRLDETIRAPCCGAGWYRRGLGTDGR